mgnify:CR=1 FL=1
MIKIDGTGEIRTFLGKAYQYDVKTSIGNLIVNSENSVVYEKGNLLYLIFVEVFLFQLSF